MDIRNQYLSNTEVKMLDQDLLNDIRIEIISSYSDDEIHSHSNFSDFFTVVCMDNGYEPDWEEKEEFYKPYYEMIFNEIINRLIKERL